MKNKQSYFSIGLMSGSSLDGLDIAYCEFNYNDKWTVHLLKKETVPLKEWEVKLPNAQQLTKQELEVLSKDFALFMAKEVKAFILNNKIKKLDLVASHGHTIYHYPEQGETCQIGDGQTLSNALECKVVANLRQKDMDAGGQGAPIVPIGDLHLFPQYSICLNIGGIANLSLKIEDTIKAFDVCTANQILNYYANSLGKKYDDKGNIARSGKIDFALLDALNQLAFYQQDFPKSLDNSYRNHLLEIIEKQNLTVEDKLATFVEHIAFQIHAALSPFYRSKIPPILVSGGGALNTYLIERLSFYLEQEIQLPNKDIIHYKEAIVMAFIGVLNSRGEVNVLASVTGANKDTCSGELFDSLN